MRVQGRAGLVGLAFVVMSCSDHAVPTAVVVPPALSEFDSNPAVRISEIHYDNTGTDAGEAIEISGPAGADITNWQLILYNATGGVLYNTTILQGTIPATCTTRGVVVTNYPVNGIQNGSPDGMALVDGSGTVLQFLSYEGTFAATAGPATGLTSTDIGVTEAGTEPVGQSLQRNGTGTWNAVAPNTFGACNDLDSLPPPPPPPPGLPPVRLTEIHYDNTSTDVDEAIEVEGPAGFDLAGWSVVLYNGNGGTMYDTDPLSGTIVERCNGRGVVVVTYPSNGIQNGSPDGFALVNGTTVVEFLSYEGTFAATDGPAAGLTSTDVGVSEVGSESVGLSLWRDTLGVWHAPASQTFGACNQGDVPPPPPPPAALIVINELMADPLHAAGGASWGEWFEVHNTDAAPIDMQGWTIVTAGQPAHVISAPLVVPAGGFAVLGRGADPALNGGLTIDYNYFTGSSTTIFLDANDFLVLRDAGGALVDSVRWTSGSVAKGATRGLRDAGVDNADVNGTNWGYSSTTFGDGDFGTPGAANGTLTDTPPPVPNIITFTGRLPSDVPLPVGFEDQIFATLRDGQTGAAIPTVITWSTESPALGSIDQDGVIRALAEGTALFRATADEGTTALLALPTRVAVASATALYAGNAEFGEPADGDASDDFIVRRDQYTASWSHTRGTPNWVSYDLEVTHFGAEDRCDCFTFDPLLPAQFTRYNTADYTGAGAFHGFGIDRGHLARSFDRTSASLDNAHTFYFTNIVPQASDLNQGPWAILENELGDFARFQDKEVYVIAGVAGNKGTIKNEGTIVIPTSTWKVALILPRDHGLADVHGVQDVQLIAVNMPNDAGVRNVPWQTYETTVDAIEALSGYDLLALLPDQIEIALESGTSPPAAATDGPYGASEGTAVSMSAAASSDPDGDALTFAWDFGDGTAGSGANVSHTYAQDGLYTVTVTVTDVLGLTATASTTAQIANVAPAIAAFAGATLLPGETYSREGSFTDPGADPWTATVNYGDGSGVAALPLAGKTFALSHTYVAVGSFTVTVRVSDDDATTTATQTVTVISAAQGIANAIAMVQGLVAEGNLSERNGAALQKQLEQAQRHLAQNRVTQALKFLGDTEDTLDGFVAGGQISAADAAPLQALLARITASLHSQSPTP